MKHALVIVLNSFTHDSRVLRQISTLKKRSQSVHVYALHENNLPVMENRTDYLLRRFRLATRPWPRNKLVQSLKYIECLLRMSWQGVWLKPDVVHAHDLEALPIGYVVAKLTKAKLVYDSHELWSHQAASTHFPAFLFKMAMRLETFLARRSDTVITVTDSISRHLSKEMRIPPPTVIRNVPSAPLEISDDTESPLHESLGINRGVSIVLYLGMIGRGRGLEILIDAMQWVHAEAIAVVMGGPWGTPYLHQLRTQASALRLDERVRFAQAVPPNEVCRYARGATIGIAPIEDYCLSYRYSLANKVFEYLHAGLPVAATDLPEMANLIHLYDVGELFPDSNSKAVATTLNRMLSSPPTLARYRANAIAAAKELNWSNEEQKLLSVYDRLCPANPELVPA